MCGLRSLLFSCSVNSIKNLFFLHTIGCVYKQKGAYLAHINNITQYLWFEYVIWIKKVYMCHIYKKWYKKMKDVQKSLNHIQTKLSWCVCLIKHSLNHIPLCFKVFTKLKRAGKINHIIKVTTLRIDFGFNSLYFPF